MNEELKDFKKLSIDKKVQDDIMDTFKFEHPGNAMECGMLVLSSFVHAKNQGCDMMYFHRKNSDGNSEYYKFDYIRLIEYIKTRPNDECTHSVKLNNFNDKP